MRRRRTLVATYSDLAGGDPKKLLAAIKELLRSDVNGRPAKVADGGRGILQTQSPQQFDVREDVASTCILASLRDGALFILLGGLIVEGSARQRRQDRVRLTVLGLHVAVLS